MNRRLFAWIAPLALAAPVATWAGTISGVVKDINTGGGLSQVTISDGTHSTTTDQTGAYTLTEAAGTYTLSASSSGYVKTFRPRP